MANDHPHHVPYWDRGPQDVDPDDYRPGDEPDDEPPAMPPGVLPFVWPVIAPHPDDDLF